MYFCINAQTQSTWHITTWPGLYHFKDYTRALNATNNICRFNSASWNKVYMYGTKPWQSCMTSHGVKRAWNQENVTLRLSQVKSVLILDFIKSYLTLSSHTWLYLHVGSGLIFSQLHGHCYSKFAVLFLPNFYLAIIGALSYTIPISICNM